MKQKILFQEFKSDTEAGDYVTIEGWANKSVVDDVGDMMKFDNVDLRRFKKNPIMLYNHDRNLPIGKILDMKVTPEGMWVKGKISNSKDKVVSYVRDLVKDGILKTFSIGFDPVEEQNAGSHNEITKWRLNEISIVTLPANIEAEFSLAKSLQDAKTYTEAKALVVKAMEGGGMDEDKKPEGDVKPEGEGQVEQTPEDKKSAFQDCVSAKIPKLIEEGKPEDQAVAVAMSMCREEGKCDISIMDKDMFDFAREVAKGCASGDRPEDKPEDKTDKPVEKAATDAVATPVPQPSDDPSNFGSPQLDLMKSQLALLGKMSEQLGAIASLLAKADEIVENETETPAAPAPSVEAGAKELAEVEEIRGRINSIVKDLGL